MYDLHQKRISEYGRHSPDNMARVLSFCVLSIRNRLWNTIVDMETLAEPESQDVLSGVLYGFKAQAIAEIDSRAGDIFAMAESAFYHADSERDAAESLLHVFMTCYGLGLAKSGFAVQLLYPISAIACIDSHNLERFGINPNAINSNRYKRAKTLKTKQRKVSEYCDYVAKIGGANPAQYFWDTWCAYVFARPDKTGQNMNHGTPFYKSAFHVSALHCRAFNLPEN